MDIIILIFIGLIGLSFGSFMNVLIVRVPKDLSIVKPSSYCPQCMEDLTWKDNIPLLSYILLKGRCRYCGKRIPLMYPVTELITGLLFIMVYLKFGLELDFFKYIIFVFLVFTVSFTDIYTSTDEFDTGMIPTVYIALGILSGLIFAFIEGYLSYYLAGIAAGYLVLFFPAYFYSKIRKKEGMGEGDFMFFGMIGAFLGLGYLSGTMIIPNMKLRLEDILATTYTEKFKYNETVLAQDFVLWLSTKIPEVEIGSNLPLALSAGLRTLHEIGLIKLETWSDSTPVMLYYVDGDPINGFTHISVKEAMDS